MVMLLALAWLTVSAPYVYNIQEELDAISLNSNGDSDRSNDGNENADNNLLANPSEEKTETNINNLSEYLHHHEVAERIIPANIFYFHDTSIALYRAFHGELLTPPPNSI